MSGRRAASVGLPWRLLLIGTTIAVVLALAASAGMAFLLQQSPTADDD